MKFPSSVIFSAVVLAAAQAPSVSIKPLGQAIAETTPMDPAIRADKPAVISKRTAAAGVPILGYVLGPAPSELHSITATAKSPQFGLLVTLPANIRRLFLPPRQQYSIVEQASDDPVTVWSMHRAVISGTPEQPVKVQGAMAHPDVVVFSPRGDALILYSEATRSMQVVNSLPSKPSMSRQLSLNLGRPLRAAVSDDGELVVAELGDGSLVSSWNGSAWQYLPAGCTPSTFSFIPNSHDLAISDTTQKIIMLLTIVDGAFKALHLLAQDLQADNLATTKGGEQLIAANLTSGQLWVIDLKTGVVAQREQVGSVDTLSSLRDGYTFLLSVREGLSLLKLNAVGELPDQTPHAGTERFGSTASGHH